MYSKINEPIEILVNFTKTKAQPIYFSWKNKDFEVEEINFVHQSKEGEVNLFHFSVTSKDQVFKLTLNTKFLTWTLDEIYLKDFVNDSNRNYKNAINIKEKAISKYKRRNS